MQTFGEIDGVPVEFTQHALRRMVEMSITADEVKKIILDPEEVYTSRKYPDAVNHRCGRYAMAFKVDALTGRYVVLTVLYSSNAEWLRAQQEGALSGDRSYRPVISMLRKEASRVKQGL